jgi:beta-glucosidase
MAVGYKWFQEKNLTPLFPFGFGLSYTQFAYANLKLALGQAPGGFVATFTLTNTGSVAGDEIAQVYITLPQSTGEPFRKLAGFKRVSLAPGASTTVEIPINQLVASVYSTDKQDFTQPQGNYVIEVGGSSNNLPLHTDLQVKP